MREIRDQVAARGRQLEEHKKQRGIQNAEFGSRDLVYLLALRSLNRHVPFLFHLTEARQVHPWDAYRLGTGETAEAARIDATNDGAFAVTFNTNGDREQ